jgi:hypothetical protein
MKKTFLVGLLVLLTLSSCEVDYYYNCYTFELRYEETHIPYRPTYYTITRYEKCGLTDYMAYTEARSNEFYNTWYDPITGYYTTQRQTCSYWISW